MARLNSFYLAPEAWPENGQAFLRDKEAHHLSKVLRHKPGEVVRLFDGESRWGLFEIVSVTKKESELTIIENHVDEEQGSRLTLALGWNKSNRRDWLLEKCVELQGDHLLFWQSTRSQGRVPAQSKDNWRDRTIQAAKQCGSTRLPKLTTCANIDELLKQSKCYEHKLLLWEAGTDSNLLSPPMFAKGKAIAVIGPEGGLEEQEAKAFCAAGFIPVTLGNSILRWETAALHCLSLAFFARQAC